MFFSVFRVDLFALGHSENFASFETQWSVAPRWDA